MTEEDDKQLEERVWISHKWRTPKEVDEHLEAASQEVSRFYQNLGKETKYNLE